MKDVIVIIAVTAVMIGGFFIMKRLDAFLEANEEATKKEYKNTPDVQFLDTDDYEKVISDIEKFKTTHEDIHEAIVDRATWDIVRQVRQGKRRCNSMGEVNKYSGLLYCSDCGSKLYFVRGRTMKPDAFNFICSRYRKHMGEKQCTPHSIREIALDEIILEEIRRVTSEARKHTAEFVRFISQKSSSENRKELNTKLSE